MMMMMSNGKVAYVSAVLDILALVLIPSIEIPLLCIK